MTDIWDEIYGAKPEAILITGVMLHRDGDDAVISVEYQGEWVEVARESLDSQFSHIVEPLGIRESFVRRTGK